MPNSPQINDTHVAPVVAVAPHLENLALAALQTSSSPTWIKLDRIDLESACRLISTILIREVKVSDGGPAFPTATLETLLTHLREGTVPTADQLSLLVKDEPAFARIAKALNDSQDAIGLNFTKTGYAGNRTLGIERELEIYRTVPGLDLPIITLGFRLNGSNCALEPWILIDWENPVIDPSSGDIDSRWRCVEQILSQNTEISLGDCVWSRSTPAIPRYCAEGAEFRASVRNVAREDLTLDPHLSLRSWFLENCALLEPSRDEDIEDEDKEGNDSCSLQQRLMNAHCATVQRMHRNMPVPMLEESRVDRSELEACGERQFLNAGQDFRFIVVDDYILVVGPAATGNTLLHDLEKLRQFREFCDAPPAIDDDTVVRGIGSSNANLHHTAQLVSLIGFSESQQLITAAGNFILDEQSPSDSSLIDMLLLSAGNPKQVRVSFVTELSLSPDVERDESYDETESSEEGVDKPIPQGTFYGYDEALDEAEDEAQDEQLIVSTIAQGRTVRLRSTYDGVVIDGIQVALNSTIVMENPGDGEENTVDLGLTSDEPVEHNVELRIKSSNWSATPDLRTAFERPLRDALLKSLGIPSSPKAKSIENFGYGVLSAALDDCVTVQFRFESLAELLKTPSFSFGS